MMKLHASIRNYECFGVYAAWVEAASFATEKHCRSSENFEWLAVLVCMHGKQRKNYTPTPWLLSNASMAQLIGKLNHFCPLNMPFSL